MKKKILILCIAFVMHMHAMEYTVRVKIASRDTLQQGIKEVDLDEYYGEKALRPLYDLADQEKDPQEVMSVIQSIIQRRNDKIKVFEDANPYSRLHFMKGLEELHTDDFMKVLFKDYPAALKNLQK